MMKRVCILWMIILLISSPLYSYIGATPHVSTLRRLIDNNIVYDSIAPIDSVIFWGKQLDSQSEKDKTPEFYFRVKQLLVSLYSMRGDIGPAIDEARQMYEEAETMNYDLGIALSSRAIGDAYYCSNMNKEAIDSYKEAVHYPVRFSKNLLFQDMTLLQLIFVLLQENEMKEAEEYRNMLLKSSELNTNPTLQFFTAVTEVAYYIRKNDLQSASRSISLAEEIYELDRQPSFYPFFCYAKGQYSEAKGEYHLAIQYYDRILKEIRQKMRSVNYLKVAYAKANLLVKVGKEAEAARLYDEISIVTDSVVAPSYAHRINNLRASYRENRMKVENKAEFNRIFMGGVFIGIIVLIVILYLALHIWKQNKKIIESKRRLEQSRLNAENAVKTKSLLLSNMSHEIRTPLTALSGFTGLLTDQQLDAETRQQCGEIIQQNSELLLKLINDVIDLSNLEVGDMKFNFAFCDAVLVCQNVIDSVNKVKQTRAEVRFVTSLHSLMLYTDHARLQQLLINLLINATKFTPEGSITLEVQRQTEQVALFSVTDTGCGIPLNQQDKIFNRFEKLNEGVQGTGLGLSICQLIIEHIGGKIWIDSTYTSGCRFCFTHPISDSGESRKEEQV